MTDIVPQKRQISAILRPIAEFYQHESNLLVQHLFRVHNYTYKQVGQILDVSPQAIEQKYPKEKHEN